MTDYVEEKILNAHHDNKYEYRDTSIYKIFSFLQYKKCQSIASITI